MEWWQQPFFQISAPVMVAFAVATWLQSRRDRRELLNQRLRNIERRLESLEGLLRVNYGRIPAFDDRSLLHR